LIVYFAWHQESKSARDDLYKWQITIVDSFAFVAYNDYQNSNIQNLLPPDSKKSIYDAYQILRDVYHKLKLAHAAHVFYVGYTGKGDEISKKKLKN
jgi:hypothetical protein